MILKRIKRTAIVTIAALSLAPAIATAQNELVISQSVDITGFDVGGQPVYAYPSAAPLGGARRPRRQDRRC